MPLMTLRILEIDQLAERDISHVGLHVIIGPLVKNSLYTCNRYRPTDLFLPSCDA